jgi:hypothetical protein
LPEVEGWVIVFLEVVEELGIADNCLGAILVVLKE